MAKTLASQAKDGGSIPLARSVSPARWSYQAWPAPQCGQSTEVDTGAVKT
jgi:hypothetical protein